MRCLKFHCQCGKFWDNMAIIQSWIVIKPYSSYHILLIMSCSPFTVTAPVGLQAHVLRICLNWRRRRDVSFTQVNKGTAGCGASCKMLWWDDCFRVCLWISLDGCLSPPLLTSLSPGQWYVIDSNLSFSWIKKIFALVCKHCCCNNSPFKMIHKSYSLLPAIFTLPYFALSPLAVTMMLSQNLLWLAFCCSVTIGRQNDLSHQYERTIVHGRLFQRMTYLHQRV